MYKWLKNRGVNFEERKISDLEELKHFDLVINASGCGARYLVQDDTVKPISGHVLRVEAPWIKMTMAKGQGLQTCKG